MTKAAKHPKAKATAFSCHAPEARAIFLAGTFNDWNTGATPLTKDADGNWAVALELPPGRHEFKFVVDGVWCCEPGCDGTNRDCPKCVPNPFGTMNRVIEVAE
jgi:1,4-alpha-glucan branching enzyme